ncbi:MAG: YybS family protein [Desulfotalea sp.]
MESKKPEKNNIKEIFLRIFLIAASLIFPSFDWLIFSPLQFLLPLLIFFVLTEQGFYRGNRIILIGTIFGLIGSIILSSIALFVFAVSLFPVGYLLARFAKQGLDPFQSYCIAGLALGATWALLLSGLVTPGEVSPYNQLLLAIGFGVDEAIKLYQNSSEITTDVAIMLEESLLQMKAIAPRILPAVIGSFALVLVWFTATVGNWLIARRCKINVWPHFQLWVLPEKLIWLFIVMALLFFAPLALPKFVAVNCLMLLTVIYCFQGFGITVFLMNKFKVPLLLRSFIYVMIIFQSFGTIILVVLGLADTWFNFRKLPNKGTPEMGNKE